MKIAAERVFTAPEPFSAAVSNATRYVVEISDLELREVELDPIDHDLIRLARDGKISDVLLALEGIARKLERAKA